jgi:hypothetical protein
MDLDIQMSNEAQSFLLALLAEQTEYQSFVEKKKYGIELLYM